MGAGSAGCVVASRLSEDAASLVAVLEAGDEEDATPDVHVPHKFVDLVRGDADWAFYTVPQEHACKGLQGNVSSSRCARSSKLLCLYGRIVVLIVTKSVQFCMGKNHRLF